MNKNNGKKKTVKSRKNVRRFRDKNLIKDPAGALAVCFAFVLILFGFFFTSMFDKDKLYSEREGSKLEQFSDIGTDSLIDGSYFEKFEKYYKRQFPMRDSFLDINGHIVNIFERNTVGAEEKYAVVEVESEDEFRGASID